MILSIKSWRTKKKLRKPIILTRITDWKIPCVYIHVYQIIKNRGPGPYNSLRHADNKIYFPGRSLTRNWRETHMIYMAREVGKIWRCSRWEKGNFIMINEFKYGQTWKIWPSPLSLSLYSTFNYFYKRAPWPSGLCLMKAYWMNLIMNESIINANF